MAGVVGTGIFSNPPAALANTLDATTQKYILPTLGDVTFKPSPVFWAMLRRGKDIRGGAIVYGIITQEELTGGAYYGAQLLNTATTDSVQPAEQQWRFYNQMLSIPYTDLILNRGGDSLSLLQAKYQIATASFLQKLSRALWHTSPQNTSLDIDDVNAWVGTQNNVIAGIDRSANSFWNPPASVANGGGALSTTNAESAYQTLVSGYDEPDLMTLTNGGYAGFKGSFTTLNRYTDPSMDEEALQAGFRYHFMFNNAVVVPDKFNPAQTSFLLNTKYVYPVFHEDMYFRTRPWAMPTDQDVLISGLFLGWQLICPSPINAGIKITGLSA